MSQALYLRDIGLGSLDQNSKSEWSGFKRDLRRKYSGTRVSIIDRRSHGWKINGDRLTRWVMLGTDTRVIGCNVDRRILKLMEIERLIINTMGRISL